MFDEWWESTVLTDVACQEAGEMTVMLKAPVASPKASPEKAPGFLL